MSGGLSGLLGLIVLVVIIVSAWKGVSRAGYSGVWSLLLVIPLVNIIMIYVFAFSTWPVERR